VSTRGRRRASWLDSASLLWDVDEDEMASHWGEVEFSNVPLGNGDIVNLSVRTGRDDRGAVVIMGLDMNKPINARRIKALPLAAIRQECSRVIAIEDRQDEQRFRRQDFVEDKIEEVKRQLAIIGTSDRHSPEFLLLVADLVCEARSRGIGGWNVVADALGHPDGRPMSRAMAQRYMKRAADAGYEMSSLSRSTDQVSPISSRTGIEGE
jgi:hypothetical protein